jgi:hypothetical protein
MVGTTEKLIQDWQQRRDKAAAQRRTEWRADHTDIPDLEFRTPDCPICDLETEYEDGYFTCWPCDVSWLDNGYGHQASHADGSEFEVRDA